uniref:Uncharacterized protein n=1 Tax=Mus spicilegus TaxID=10103 RepID=A0A8C6GWF2_MUSSI
MRLHLPQDMCPQAGTRSAWGQSDRQALLQEAQVAFHLPRIGTQLLSELFQLLHQSLVEHLSHGLHSASELLHLLLQLPVQVFQRLLQPFRVALHLALHVFHQRGQILLQLVDFCRDLGLELLRILLHLEGQALHLMVEFLLHAHRQRGQAAAQILQVLVDRGLQLVGTGG